MTAEDAARKRERAAPEVRLAVDSDADAFARHVERHMAESGREGSPAFALSRRVSRDEVREGALSRWERPLDEPLWGRAWLLVAPDVRPKSSRVVGHVELRGGRVRAELHRATLGMGIERAWTGRGHGRQLLDAAIAWARQTARLSWIDLGVFSNNAPARRLYTSAGFVEIGVREDAFRIDDGVVITDVMMVLNLR